MMRLLLTQPRLWILEVLTLWVKCVTLEKVGLLTSKISLYFQSSLLSLLKTDSENSIKCLTQHEMGKKSLMLQKCECQTTGNAHSTQTHSHPY
jgi:hypothetical protein